MNGPTVGQRVRLTGEMPGEAKYQPLPVGSTGVVVREANSVGQVWVRWDPPNENRRLMLLTTDPFEVVDEARNELQARRALAQEITGFLLPAGADEDDGRGARAKRDGAILIVYGHGRGDFQTISVEQAAEYRDLLAAGELGAPWKLGIR